MNLQKCIFNNFWHCLNAITLTCTQKGCDKKAATAQVSWPYPEDAWGGALQIVCSLHSFTWEKEARPTENIIPVLYPKTIGRYKQHVTPKGYSWLGSKPKWLEKICDRLLRSRPMMMMMTQKVLIFFRPIQPNKLNAFASYIKLYVDCWCSNQ